MSPSAVNRVSAPPLINFVAAQVGAKGGGRDDLARAGGGTNPEALPEALASVNAYLSEHLG